MPFTLHNFDTSWKDKYVIACIKTKLEYEIIYFSEIKVQNIIRFLSNELM